jgi:hypothetical protein
VSVVTLVSVRAKSFPLKILADFCSKLLFPVTGLRLAFGNIGALFVKAFLLVLNLAIVGFLLELFSEELSTELDCLFRLQEIRGGIGEHGDSNYKFVFYI